jgi:hypothetical protein
MRKSENVLIKDHDTFRAVLAEAQLLRWRKLQDYGQSYRGFGPLGVVVRMSDKMARIANLINNGKKPNNESLRDSAIDLINYSTMLVLLLDEERKGK